jgi:antiviral helicase SKI2
LPCIVFAFSRAGTVKYAEELDPSTDFTDGYTKGLIKKFIKQKLQRLDEVDRDLPQIQTVTRLLVRGIGVHHAGLIQLLKELVEILFSDGYLKLVFATSTFAIGLNLPARSVVFTELQKFDGTDRSTITTSEYLQMAGRAGRRGKDQIGYSLLCMDPGMGKMPRSEELTELLDSKGIALESKLKVDYSTCLNSLK